MTGSALGEFLRTARSHLQPDDAGVATVGRRRVPGLRREEVAVLAGMNSDYYARLEQGRETRPSPQILDALCNALQLDDNARDHLYSLAGTVPSTRSRQPEDAIEPSLRQLLDGYLDTPAFILNPAMDVLMVNGIGRALFSPFDSTKNLAHMTFVDPAASSFYCDWSRSAENVVASLRHATGTSPDYPRLGVVIDELIDSSPEFGHLWHRPDVREKSRDSKNLVHPEVGRLDLRYHTFDVRGACGQQLVVYNAPAGTPTSERLMLLGALHADDRRR